MKRKILLISPVILIFLRITEFVYSAEIAGNAHYYSFNGNFKDSIEAELRQIDLMAAIGEKSVPMGAVKLKLSGDAWVFFELEFEVSPDHISGRQPASFSGGVASPVAPRKGSAARRAGHQHLPHADGYDRRRRFHAGKTHLGKLRWPGLCGW